MAYTLTYSFSSNAYSVTGYTGTPDDVAIPSIYNDGTHGDYPVTSIGSSAFQGCSSLTSVVIGDSVTTISDYAFSYCSSLKKVLCLPSAPPTLGSDVFTNTRTDLQIIVDNSVVNNYKAATNWTTYAAKISGNTDYLNYAKFSNSINNVFVKKETGKGLSTNDYTVADKNKVALIDNTGDGTKYLANDGTYKTVSGGISDVKMDTTSIVSSGVATIPKATMNTLGVVKTGANGINAGLVIDANGNITTQKPYAYVITGSNPFTYQLPVSANSFPQYLKQALCQETGSAGDYTISLNDTQKAKVATVLGIPTIGANPTLVGTEDNLSSIDINGTKYAIPSGGGVTVVQATGTSTTAVMSQNAVTTELNKKQNIMQVTSMPTDAVDGQIVQWVGADDTQYKTGYFYRCVDFGTWKIWYAINVQDPSIPKKMYANIDNITSNGIYLIDYTDGVSTLPSFITATSIFLLEVETSAGIKQTITMGNKVAYRNRSGSTWGAWVECSINKPYELIEKVIVGYSVLTSEPSDWATNWTNYYQTNGQPRNSESFNYTQLSGSTAPTWESAKYYSYDSTVIFNGKVNTEPDGTAYKFNKTKVIMEAVKGSTRRDYYRINPSYAFYCNYTLVDNNNNALSMVEIICDRETKRMYSYGSTGGKNPNYYSDALKGSILSSWDLDTILPDNVYITQVDTGINFVANSILYIYGVRG